MSKSFVCEGCQSQVPLQISDFGNHYFTSCSEEIFHQCQIEDCMQCFISRDDLYEHGREVHPNINFYEETFVILNEDIANAFCLENSITPLEHEPNDFQIKPYQPHENPTLNKSDKNGVAAGGKKIFQCTLENCKSKFSSKKSRWRHETSVHKLRVKCPLENCNKRIKPAEMSNHIKQFHKMAENEVKEAQNDENKSLPELSNKSTTKNLVSQKEEGKFPCFHENCGAIFATRKKARQHLKNVHRPPLKGRQDHFKAMHTRVKCTEENCDSLVKRKHLYQHMKAMHDDTKKQCEHCKKWFSYLSMHNHLRRCTSNGERKVTCVFEGCKATFTTTANRSSHMNRVHKMFARKKNSNGG